MAWGPTSGGDEREGKEGSEWKERGGKEREGKVSPTMNSRLLL